jgi:hypothetical protein
MQSNLCGSRSGYLPAKRVNCTLVQALRLCTGRTVNCTLVQALRLCTGRTFHRGSKCIALSFHDHGTRRGWGVSVTPRPLFTPGKTRYHLYRRLGGPQGQAGQVRKITPPPGFDTRTVQPVASRYTDWATWPNACHWGSVITCRYMGWCNKCCP